ncbi:hypothetical protein Ciccas_001718 [Cichlidogyrus casuarinus]|uniref:Uncharacterized protein n=1 Tax=Cichlidogyrus casuarinus TaxID=1844966 RepID=A0ABD2QJC9_9PLAT
MGYVRDELNTPLGFNRVEIFTILKVNQKSKKIEFFEINSTEDVSNLANPLGSILQETIAKNSRLVLHWIGDNYFEKVLRSILFNTKLQRVDDSKIKSCF